MSKLFVTVLGTNDYFDCYYCKGNKNVRTPFVQEALTKLLYPNQKFDMKILLTEKAKKNNYDGKGKLKEILEKNNITPELVIIPEGKDEDELWDIFEKIRDEINKSANKLCKDNSTLDVTIDITHSLRNIPMQIVVAMNYLTLFNDINLEGIYYGAYELGEMNIDDKLFSNKDILNKLYNQKNINNDIIDKLKLADSDKDLDEDTKEEILANFRDYKGCTIKHAPICNLDVYYDLLKWTNAINSFIKCGNTKEIERFAYTKKTKAFKFGTKEEQKDIVLINDVVQSLNNFTNCINTCRGKYYLSNNKKSSEKNSIKFAANTLYSKLQKLNENISIKPLKNLFELVKKEVKPFVNKNNLEIGIATIDWCIKYNLYQQGYTALEESLKTLLCIKLKLKNKEGTEIDETDIVNREDIANIILNCSKCNNKTKNYEPIPKEKISFSKNATEEDKKIAIDNLNILSKNKKFYEFVESVKNYRNDVNHFGFSSNGAAEYDKLSNTLLELRNKLVEYSQGEFPWMEVEEIEN